MTITQADFEDAARRTAILERELDITNADHIALWLEASRPLDNAISWLACRIIEAHEIEIAKAVRAAEARAREEGAKAMQTKAVEVAAWSHMVPPDGGSPSEAECAVARAASDAIAALDPAQIAGGGK